MSICVALIAHDSKQDDIVALAKKYRATLSRYHLIATDETGGAIAAATGLEIERLASRAQGGIVQVAARVVTGEVMGVIFLMDALQPHPYEADYLALLRVCNLHEIPLATNIATAELSIQGVAKRREAYLIFNPVAGQGNPDRDLALIRQILEPQLNLHTIFTQPDIEPAVQAREAIEAMQSLKAEVEPGCIIACGGDGTVSAIAGATINTGIPLGVIPRGTANAFAVALGLPTDLKWASETIASGNTRMVDAAYCNDVPMVLLAGVGFEAGMVNNASRELKNRLGTLAYVFSAAQQFFTQEDFNVMVELDGEILEFKTGAVTIANSAPPTSVMAQGFGEVIPDDGLLEVTIPVSNTLFQDINTSATLLASALVKSQFEDSNLVCLRTAQLKVTTDPPQTLVVDGEILEANPIEFTCVPKGLTVFSPLSTI
ncbi:methylglyoxal synthase [filamentous cyanobacterium LEGE 11480]|uniref:Methylglyoxal synthase n=1 Tax=Romeriopsis navalis LEGE 11480 TaxID=2777977 RepID=A0A928VP04_9CYAN|nr:methylglyoxal synthase [Romeriopsis navalis]MBE9029489.1 methylglyoxal synthase [Romeriopsis navalis LEGE 11480]